MLKILLDTCVFLDLAEKADQRQLLSVLNTLIVRNKVELIVPKLVVDEFNRNKERVVQQSVKGQSTILRKAIELLEQQNHQVGVTAIHDVALRLRNNEELASDSVSLIVKMLNNANVYQVNDKIIARAAQRALMNQAPCHRGKNSFADAVIFETYTQEVESSQSDELATFAFVSSNHQDFSDPKGDTRKPHPDLSNIFDGERSRYFSDIRSALATVDPELVEEANAPLPQSEQRWSSEVDKVHLELYVKFRYERYRRRPTTDKLGPGLYDAAERLLGVENLMPRTDFEYGEIVGRLSMIHWMSGEVWDVFDP